jgi:hypothetical protein
MGYRAADEGADELNRKMPTTLSLDKGNETRSDEKEAPFMTVVEGVGDREDFPLLQTGTVASAAARPRPRRLARRRR